MKKTVLKYFFFIILSLFIILFIVNCSIYFLVTSENKVNESEYPLLKRENPSIENYMDSIKFNEIPFGEEYKNKGIIIFGCGVPGGFEQLNTKDYFSHKLADETKRPVYDRSIPGFYMQNSLIQVRSHRIDDIIKNSEYVIYYNPGLNDSLRLISYPGPYFDGHFLFAKYLYPKFFINKDNNLQLYKSKIPVLEGSILYRLANKYSNEKEQRTNDKFKHELEALFVKHAETLQQELKAINPNIKFIMMVYFDNPEPQIEPYKELEQKGIQILYAYSLIPNLYEISDKYMEETGTNDPRRSEWDIMVNEIKKYIKK